jgi:predicted DNA-binding protein YlxM (UPF0122 family)
MSEAQRGERHPRAKLTEKQVLEIRKRYAALHSQRELAEAFGVSQTAIAEVIQRKTWRHL